MISYYSTRDKNKTLVSFEEALLKGLAADGGLYIPNQIPSIDPKHWLEAKTLADVGVNVLQHWLKDEMPQPALETIVRDALNFPCPVVKLKDDLFVLELFHGPTLSFKDFGARTMARLMQYFLSKRNEKRLILVATSGDTGSAVADGFAGQDNIEVVLLYPKGKVSDVQERQLITKRPGVKALAVTGNFDDCQRMVKEAFLDKDLQHLPLSSANSINIGRLLPQSLYYFWAANQVKYVPDTALVSAQQDEYSTKIAFCVPSGNLGNLTSGILASRMGLSVHLFLAAHNANNYFPNFLHSQAKPYEFKPTLATISNAMDVGAPSNFERIEILFQDELKTGKIWGDWHTDEQTLDEMKDIYDETGYIACPHTAIGLRFSRSVRDFPGKGCPNIILGTAHPAKFPEAVLSALGFEPPKEEALEGLLKRDTNVTVIPPSLEALKQQLA